MSDATIGIKIADGSYYPVLEGGFTGRKTLTLTTVRDGQAMVQIELYSCEGATMDQASYLGSLVIENIPAAKQGEPEIDLVIGVDTDGELFAEASDLSTGESQKFETSLASASPTDTLGEDTQEEVVLDEAPLTGEAYPATESIRQRETPRRKGPNILLLILFVVLGVALVVAIAWFVYRGIQAAPVQPIAATPAPAAAAPAAAPAQPAPAATEDKPAPAAAASTAGSASTSTARTGVTYRIKRGDTLWDIAATYYRNPWLYPRLAKANSIRNPDLIFAGTRIIIPAN